MARKVRIVVVGDVHGDWSTELDGRALELLAPDVVLFVGDFGDEEVKVVQEVSKLKLPKAVMLGNHDCFYSAHHKCRSGSKSNRWSRVEQQLEALGDSHVGYSRKDFPELKLSVIGCRPFGAGSDKIYNRDFISQVYGVNTMQQSAEKIAKLASEAPEGHTLVLLGHNGPTGLGSQANDICGIDFKEGGGDHGDPDLAQALGKIRAEDGDLSRVALVVFGHMHRSLLRSGGKRTMCVFNGSYNNPGPIYVNAAVVPRCTEIGRNFTVVDMEAGRCPRVLKVQETWVEGGEAPNISCQQTLFEAIKGIKQRR